VNFHFGNNLWKKYWKFFCQRHLDKVIYNRFKKVFLILIMQGRKIFLQIHSTHSIRGLKFDFAKSKVKKILYCRGLVVSYPTANEETAD
jgi:hypothetical protein